MALAGGYDLPTVLVIPEIFKIYPRNLSHRSLHLFPYPHKLFLTYPHISIMADEVYEGAIGIDLGTTLRSLCVLEASDQGIRYYLLMCCQL